MDRELFDELEAQEYDFLDSLEIDKILTNTDSVSVSELMSWLENEYEDEYLEKHPNDDCLFNCISMNDFAVYLKNRYGWFMSEIQDYSIYC